MYEYQPMGDSNFGEFGFVLPLIIGIAQHITLGVAAITKWKATEKYGDKTKKTQQMSHQAQLEYKKAEAEAQQKLLLQKGQTELYRDERLKKLVIIGVMTTIAVTVIGLGTYIAFSVGGGDE